MEFDHIAPQFSINYNNDFEFDKIYKLEDLDQSKFVENEFNINNETINKSDHYNNCDNSQFNVENAFQINYEELLYLKKEKKIPNYKCFYNEEIKRKVEEIYKNDFNILLNYNIDYKINI